jgi:hypothetical protein
MASARVAFRRARVRRVTRDANPKTTESRAANPLSKFLREPLD